MKRRLTLRVRFPLPPRGTEGEIPVALHRPCGTASGTGSPAAAPARRDASGTGDRRRPCRPPATAAPRAFRPRLGWRDALLIAVLAWWWVGATVAEAGRWAVGPDYVPPTNAVPGSYKGAGDTGVWKEGRPLDHVPKGPWWEVFGDPVLNDLQARAAAANLDLKAAVARVEQARASARVSKSGLFPSVDFNPSWRRERYSPNQEPSFGDLTAETIRIPLDLSYEIDLWGRVRRGFEEARAGAQATLAAFQGVLLSLHADVARNHFALRAIDAEIAAVTRTTDLRREQVRLVRSRFEGGIGNELDVARAETELATAESEGSGLARRRAELENALALLVGENPSTFRHPPLTEAGAAWAPAPPEIPAGLPSELLERRPDVAEAERQLAAANARIGVAKASFFPVLRLTASGGYVSGDLDTLFDWEGRVWHLGPSLSLPIFAGGRNKANLARSKAAYEEAVHRYRQQVLVAFRDVEDSLSAIRHLADQSAAQERAVASALRASQLAESRYRSGIVSYLEVVDANRAALVSQRLRAILAGQRLIASVQLVRALGGGWQVSAPSSAAVARPES